MKRKKSTPINASSMADIAFLLLIFFLVTTSLDQDKGILTMLPPYDGEEYDSDPVNKRNMLSILVDKNDRLMVNYELLPLSELKETTKEFLTNNGQNKKLSDSPQKAIVSILNDIQTSYDAYFTVYNELRAAYNEVRDEYAKERYNQQYIDLSEEKQKEVRKLFPLRISEAEPEQIVIKK